MSEAKKLPSGKWRNRLYVGKDSNGKRIYESFTAATKKEADALAAVRAREIELGVKKKNAPANYTVAEAVSDYLESNEAVLKPKTIREYKGYAKRYLQDLLRLRIRDLTPTVCQRAINKEAKRLSPKSVRLAWAFLSAAIRAVTPDFHPDVNLPALVPKEMEIPTDEQLLELLAHVTGQRLEIPFLLAAACGLRRGEIAALDFRNDFDYTTNRIRVHRSMQEDADTNWFVIDGAKTESSTRWVDCPPWIMDKIKSLPSDYKPVSAPYMSNRFREVADAHGLKQLHFHNLRHYYASLLISKGCPDQYITARMGHATNNMLRRVYGHIIADRDKEFTDKVNAHFNSMHHEMHHDEIVNTENPNK